MTEIPSAYSPHEIEKKWYKFWLEKGYFSAAEKIRLPALCNRYPAAEHHRESPRRATR